MTPKNSINSHRVVRRSDTINYTITIDPRFNGPDGSGNGGYTCGLLAAYVDGPAEITLRTPVPLNQALAVRREEGGHVTLWSKETLIAEAAPNLFDLEPPAMPDVAAAEDASTRYGGFHFHPYPECFVCGPQRPAKDGLGIFAGQIPETGIFAATWIPAEDLADGDGRVKPEFIWASLDCPGGIATLGNLETPIILGRMAANVLAPVYAGERYIPLGWRISQEGRKIFVGTALYAESGELCGVAKATWIVLSEDLS